MTAAVGQDESAGEAQRNGLALLRLMAEAADAREESQHWVNRRVEQLEFLDVRAVRWRVSVDFEVPETAPVTDVGGQEFRLVPLTSWEKDNLVAFDLRDETGTTLWLPTSAETDHLLSSALICWAGTILKQSPAQMPAELKETLKAIVSEKPPQKDEDKDLFAYMTRLMTIKDGEDECARYLSALKGNLSFWSQVNELWRNFLIIVAVPDKPRSRHVFKMTFESKIGFRQAGSMRQRIAQSMGWRAWRLELFIGGRGGSQHLEIAAPPGVEIVRIRARPRAAAADRSTYVTSYGGSPHVHIRIPAQRLRYLATTRVRVSRPGWLTTCWLAGLVIALVLLSAAVKLSVLFSNAPEAGTAATLLLALLGVLATMLVDPGAHPLASRLLLGSRILVAIDSGAVLLAAGSLLLDSSRHPPTPGWWALFAVSLLCAVGLTGSRFRPKGPQKTMASDSEKEQEDQPAGQAAQLDLTSLEIPAADGYHYSDQNEWGEDEQHDLVCELRKAENAAFGAS
jgi:hypothetical protein